MASSPSCLKALPRFEGNYLPSQSNKLINNEGAAKILTFVSLFREKINNASHDMCCLR